MCQNPFAPLFDYVRALVGDGPAQLPSAVLGVADANGVIEVQAFRAREDSIYLLFSVTKPIIGIAVAQLWERGQIGLYDSLQRYIPDFGQTRSDTVTIWHLLTHTSGIDQSVADLVRQTLPEGILTPHQALVSAPAQFPAGAYKLYNNLAFVGLQEVIEAVTGQPLEAVLAQQIFEPLGMRDTSFVAHEAAPDRTMPTHGTEGVLDYPRYLRLKTPAGGLFSTAADLLALGRALLNGGALNGKRILAPLTLRAMTTPHTTGIPPLKKGEEFIGSEVGLTWMLPVSHMDYIVRTQYGHDGWGGCMFWVYPEQGVCFVLLTNLLSPERRGVMLDRLHNVFAACL
ncbi:MAG: serine hydrolase domain-containing protein [Anaerolineae bacterium]|nr:serine hydrolase domain-containing protein [Anaerolineae bacterium]